MKESNLDKTMPDLLDTHSKELTLVALMVLVLVTLMIIVPQLLRAHMRRMEMLHDENLKMIAARLTTPATTQTPSETGKMCSEL